MNSFITVNNLAIHVTDLRPERDTAMVFLHGRCLSSRMWERQLESERLDAYRLVAFDLPGHGLSAHSNDPSSAYSVRGFIDSLTGVVSKLGLTRFILIGCSLGGHIALEALPDLGGCIGVFAMTMPITKPADFGKMFLPGELLSRVFSEQFVRSDVPTYTRLLLRPDATEYPEFLEEDFYAADSRMHQAIVQCMINLEYSDETEIIRQSNVPVAVVAGAEEQFHNLGYLDTLLLKTWQDRVIRIPSAGHLVGWENAAEVNRLLALFAEECVKISGI